MEENNTILQLNEALGELLDAYDKLKSENEELENKLEEVTQTKNQEIEDLIKKNNLLEGKVDSLTSTTKHHSSELDTMLGRIKSTLGSSLEKKETRQKMISEEQDSSTVEVTEEEEIAEETESLLEDGSKQEEVKEAKKEGSKEIDLGRMQSLLNGFNS